MKSTSKDTTQLLSPASLSMMSLSNLMTARQLKGHPSPSPTTLSVRSVVSHLHQALHYQSSSSQINNKTIPSVSSINSSKALISRGTIMTIKMMGTTTRHKRTKWRSSSSKTECKSWILTSRQVCRRPSKRRSNFLKTSFHSCHHLTTWWSELKINCRLELVLSRPSTCRMSVTTVEKRTRLTKSWIRIVRQQSSRLLVMRQDCRTCCRISSNLATVTMECLQIDSRWARRHQRKITNQLSRSLPHKASSNKKRPWRSRSTLSKSRLANQPCSSKWRTGNSKERIWPCGKPSRTHRSNWVSSNRTWSHYPKAQTPMLTQRSLRHP